MIEVTVREHLNSELAESGIKCYLERPKAEPAEYILIERTSGGETNRICSATFAVQSYAQSMYRAASINELAKAAMETLTTETNVSSCRLNSDYNYTDVESKQYRYQATFDIYYIKET